MEKTKTPIINIPTAIIIAGAIVAGAVIYTSTEAPPRAPGAQAPEKIDLAPITANDHLLGDPKADLIIVEYSDMECPFCKRFHGTMNQVMEKYGADGSVAWVYRHFPIDSLHSKARKEAEATECAGELGGNDSFWDYTQLMFDVTPSNNGLDLAVLPDLAAQTGLNEAAFVECLDSGRYADRIVSDLQSGVDAGVRGTPASFILTKKGEVIPITGGAQPFEVVSALIEANL